MKKIDDLKFIFSNLNGRGYTDIKQYLNHFFSQYEAEKEQHQAIGLEELEEKNAEEIFYLEVGEGNLKQISQRLSAFKNLKVLDISGNVLKDFKEISRLKKLEILFLEKCSLRSVPKEISKLKELAIVELRSNYLIKICPETFRLKNLVMLDVRDNKINELPGEIKKFKNLIFLNLSQNQIPALPDELGELPLLKHLDLHGNLLESLPTSLGDLSNLNYLNMGNNQLSELPTEVGNLNKLEHLYLNDNQFRALPQELTKLKKLETLHFKNNPFGEMPELNHVSSVELFSYLNKVSDNGTYKVVWEVPKAFQTSFVQYLVFFPEFVERYTGKEIHFQVTRAKKGVQITAKRNRHMGIKEINKYLKKYIDILNLNINDLYEIVNSPSSETQSGFELRQLVRDTMREKNHFMDKVQDHLERLTFLSDSQEKQKEQLEGLDFHIRYFQSYSSDLMKLVKNNKSLDLTGSLNFEITNDAAVYNN